MARNGDTRQYSKNVDGSAASTVSSDNVNTLDFFY